MFELDKSSPVPLYQQIKDFIKSKIESGEWKKDEKLPSEENLTAMLNVSRGTLKQAIKELIEEGFLIQIHGKGTFISGYQMEYSLPERLISIAEAISENNKEFKTHVLGIEVRYAGAYESKYLKLNEDQKVFVLKRIRYSEGDPIVYLENSLPVTKFPTLDSFDFEEKTLFSVIEEDFNEKIEWGKRSFVAIGADDSISGLLEIEKGTPVTFLEQVVYGSSNEPLECSKVWIRNDKIKLTSIIRRF